MTKNIKRYILSKLMIYCPCNKCYKKWKKQDDFKGYRTERYVNSKNTWRKVYV